MRLPIPSSLEGRLRLAGTLVGIGLCVEFATLFWVHPLSFMTFAGIAAVLVGLGIIVFLLAIVRDER
jgi:uncharacterized membrane protein